MKEIDAQTRMPTTTAHNLQPTNRVFVKAYLLPFAGALGSNKFPVMFSLKATKE